MNPKSTTAQAVSADAAQTSPEMAQQAANNERIAEPLLLSPPVPLRVLTMNEFLGEPIAPREFVLAPWLLSQSLSMIYAWRGVGKTFVALNIAYAVASGGTFFSWRAERPRRVLYLDGEMAAADLQMRLRGIALGDQRDFDASYLRILTPDLQRRPMPDLATRAGQAEIDAISKDTELIIVDNISTLVRDVARENDAESWNEVGAWALRMRQKGRSVLFLHHSGKGGSQRAALRKKIPWTLSSLLSFRQTTRPNRRPDSRSILKRLGTGVARS